MSRFWSPIVSKLAPYTPGEQPRGQSFVKLNTNENPYGPSPRAIAAIAAEAGDALRLYPDPLCLELRQAIGAEFGLSADHVFVGNGSDEVLAHAFNAFFRGRGALSFADVTYSFYRSYCELFELAHRCLPLDDTFRCDPALYRAAEAGVVLANPNAPTGIALPLAAIEQILRQTPDRVVLVDEAYVDFGAQSAAGLVAAHDNLVVVQTFSKSRSLAGLRVGFALAQPHLIEGLTRIKDSFNSYPLDRLALVAARAAWEDRDWFEQTRSRIIDARETTAARLAQLGFTVLPSAANFLFVSHPARSAPDLLAALRSRGILVRHFPQERILNWLRISIGTMQECDALIAACDDCLIAAD